MSILQCLANAHLIGAPPPLPPKPKCHRFTDSMIILYFFYVTTGQNEHSLKQPKG